MHMCDVCCYSGSYISGVNTQYHAQGIGYSITPNPMSKSIPEYVHVYSNEMCCEQFCQVQPVITA